MASPRSKGLGRGLDALLGPGPAEGAAAGRGREIPVELIARSPWQPRRKLDPDALEDLSRSIRAHGVLQPILVRPVGEDRYELVAGERRWRAAQAAGLATVPAVVREVSDEVALSIAIIENIQREDLTPLEEARGVARLIEEFGMTHREVAEAVGRSRPAVSNLLRLLDLNDDVRGRLESGEIEMGHARALLGLAGGVQSEAARIVGDRGLSVRQTEALVRRMQSAPGSRCGRSAGARSGHRPPRDPPRRRHRHRGEYPARQARLRPPGDPLPQPRRARRDPRAPRSGERRRGVVRPGRPSAPPPTRAPARPARRCAIPAPTPISRGSCAIGSGCGPGHLPGAFIPVKRSPVPDTGAPRECDGTRSGRDRSSGTRRPRRAPRCPGRWPARA